MHIIEIYKSLQGESSFSGVPCVFVRLAGCNLRCTWCDSEYTFKGGIVKSLDEVAAEVVRLSPKCGLVEITGGEPLLQEREAVALMQRLLARNYTLLLETSGERPLNNVPAEVHKIVDVKCPGSGEGGTFLMENLEFMGAADEVKFVISDRADFEFARDFTRAQGLESRVDNVIFSPAFPKDAVGARSAEHCTLDPKDLADWILAEELEVRLGFQIHKFIWQPQIKGV